jgi:hypothetical protein
VICAWAYILVCAHIGECTAHKAETEAASVIHLSVYKEAAKAWM